MGWDLIGLASLLALAILAARWYAVRPGRCRCPDCGAAVAQVVWPTGARCRVDPPVFDPAVGWIARPHLCGESIERCRGGVRTGDEDEGEKEEAARWVRLANGNLWLDTED